MTTITELLTDLNIEFRQHGEAQDVGHGWIGLICPMCHHPRYLLGINLRSLAVSCWRCGRHRLGDVLAAASGRTIREVLPLIRQLDAYDASSGPRSEFRPSGRYQPPSGVAPLLAAHRRCLERWGFDPDECVQNWNIQGIGPGGEFRWRLFVPVVRAGKPVSWTTRAIGERVALRYRSANPEHESVPIKHCLWGEDHAYHSAVIVEGFKQAMRIGRGAVATMGVGYTEQQLIRMSWFARRTIVFDNEPAAQRRAVELADALSIFPGETFTVCLSGPQPDSSPAEEIAELRKGFLE